MSGLLDGFQRGYGMMDNHYSKQDARNFRDTQYQDQQARLAKQDKRVARQDKMNENEHVLRMQGLAQGNALNGKQLANYDDDRVKNNEIKDQQIKGQGLINQGRQQTLNTNSKAATQKKQKEMFMEVAQALEGYRVGMNVNMDRIHEISKQLQGTQYGFLFNDIQQRTIEMLNADLDAGQGLSKETLLHINQGGIPEIKAAIGKPSRYGSPITDVVATNVVNDESGEGFRVALVVTDQDGNTYNSFINEERDANSPIKSVNSDSVFKHLASQKYILDEARESGFLDSLKQHSAMQMQAQSQRTPAKIQYLQMLEQKYGADAARQFALFGKIQDPQKRQDAISKFAYTQASREIGFENLSKVEQQKRAAEIANQFNMLGQLENQIGNEGESDFKQSIAEMIRNAE